VTGLRLPPVSLYIHIPWCERKCPYCDFNSHEFGGSLPETEYIAALLLDLETDQHWLQDRALQSIFIGGGTPSLLSVDALNALLDGVRARVSLRRGCEITLEANPGSAEAEKFAGFAAAGINRMSLGIQSFNDLQLQALGRIHSGDQARTAVDMARRAGIENLNLDLMHGLPGQSPADAATDIAQAMEMETPHLSWYQLTIERNTGFWKQPPKLPRETALAAIQAQGEALLEGAGYRNYEVSAYALPGYSCRHNLNYWQFGDYLGIGAGAHGKITLPASGGIIRTAKRRQPGDYLASGSAGFTVSSAAIPDTQLCGDFALNALRLTDGFDNALFEERTGLSIADIGARVTALEDRELLVRDGERVRTSELGRRYLDDVIAEFL
jgi:oxygen-independent coproporphyrinogen-3 oxidase